MESRDLEQKLGSVAVPLTVTMGGHGRPVRELLELRVGSILPVGMRVGEPMELSIGGRLVARGEVVVVNGRLALRIVETGPAQDG